MANFQESNSKTWDHEITSACVHYRFPEGYWMPNAYIQFCGIGMSTFLGSSLLPDTSWIMPRSYRWYSQINTMTIINSSCHCWITINHTYLLKHRLCSNMFKLIYYIEHKWTFIEYTWTYIDTWYKIILTNNTYHHLSSTLDEVAWAVAVAQASTVVSVPVAVAAQAWSESYPEHVNVGTKWSSQKTIFMGI